MDVALSSLLRPLAPLIESDRAMLLLLEIKALYFRDIFHFTLA